MPIAGAILRVPTLTCNNYVFQGFCRHAKIEVPAEAHEPSRQLTHRRQRIAHYPRNPARSRHHAGGIRQAPEVTGAHADADGTWHFQRNVERALLVQVLARTPQAIADTQPACGARAGRECGHHRYRRWMGLRFQNRVTQSSFVHRAVSGSHHRRWRHPARHLHHGGATGCGDGFTPDLARSKAPPCSPTDGDKDGAPESRSPTLSQIQGQDGPPSNRRQTRQRCTRTTPSWKVWSAELRPTATVSAYPT